MHCSSRNSLAPPFFLLKRCDTNGHLVKCGRALVQQRWQPSGVKEIIVQGGSCQVFYQKDKWSIVEYGGSQVMNNRECLLMKVINHFTWSQMSQQVGDQSSPQQSGRPWTHWESKANKISSGCMPRWRKAGVALQRHWVRVEIVMDAKEFRIQ